MALEGIKQFKEVKAAELAVQSQAPSQIAQGGQPFKNTNIFDTAKSDAPPKKESAPAGNTGGLSLAERSGKTENGVIGVAPVSSKSSVDNANAYISQGKGGSIFDMAKSHQNNGFDLMKDKGFVA